MTSRTIRANRTSTRSTTPATAHSSTEKAPQIPKKFNGSTQGIDSMPGAANHGSMAVWYNRAHRRERREPRSPEGVVAEDERHHHPGSSRSKRWPAEEAQGRGQQQEQLRDMRRGAIRAHCLSTTAPSAWETSGGGLQAHIIDL